MKLLVGEPKPLPFELIFENTVLFDEMADDRLLVAANPAGQGDHKEVEGLYDIGHCTNRLPVILFDNNIIRLVRIFAPYSSISFPQRLDYQFAMRRLTKSLRQTRNSR